MEISIDSEIIDRVNLSLMLFDEVQNSENRVDLGKELDALCAELRERFKSPVDARDFIQPTRKLYRSLGMDPTRYRPSSEALLRRALLDKPLYRVNTVVDIGNYFSLRFQLPVGIYDFDRLSLPLFCRLGRAGEGYEGIQKGWVNIQNKVAVFDREGPFGNPSSDSYRSRITLGSRRILFLIYAPHCNTELDKLSRIAADLIGRYCGARLLQKDLIAQKER
ncbi:hypothetical protein JW992_02445 [candidate division KSB1 bacterium]|nr:hypothetical protein [candidate division KSB1 bacterium]